MDKQDGGWWRGDYGGKRQHWFPSNYVEEIEPQQERDELVNLNIHKRTKFEKSNDTSLLTLSIFQSRINVKYKEMKISG